MRLPCFSVRFWQQLWQRNAFAKCFLAVLAALNITSMGLRQRHAPATLFCVFLAKNYNLLSCDSRVKKTFKPSKRWPPLTG